MLGEMVIFEPGSKRTATLTAQEPGLIATFYLPKLLEFIRENTAVASKLLRVMGRAAISRELEAWKDTRAKQCVAIAIAPTRWTPRLQLTTPPIVPTA